MLHCISMSFEKLVELEFDRLSSFSFIVLSLTADMILGNEEELSNFNLSERFVEREFDCNGEIRRETSNG